MAGWYLQPAHQHIRGDLAAAEYFNLTAGCACPDGGALSGLSDLAAKEASKVATFNLLYPAAALPAIALTSFAKLRRHPTPQRSLTRQKHQSARFDLFIDQILVVIAMVAQTSGADRVFRSHQHSAATIFAVFIS